MSKRNRERRDERDPAEATSGGGGGVVWAPAVLALVSIAVAFYVWTDLKNQKAATSAELAALEERVTKLAGQVATAQRPPQPSGPDPNKVYAIKTDGAPVRGNATAPIVIAEFSDYQ